MKHWVLMAILAVAIGATATAQVKPGMGSPGHKMPQAGQPAVAAPPEVPGGDLALGTVRLPRAAKANGETLKPGSYQVRLTAQEAKPDANGITEQYERWVEFVQGGQVRGREVVSIVPSAEIGKVAEDVPPSNNGSKVQVLAGGDYMRVWINRGGTHYLIHLPVG